MRKLLILSASLVALAGCGKISETTEAQSEPAAVQASKSPELTALGRLKVRPGLWEATVEGDGETLRSQTCVGDDGLAVKPEDMPENPECKPVVTAYPGGVRMSSDCSQSGVRVKLDIDYRTTETSASGEMKMSITPSGGEESTSTMRMNSRWTSACPAGMEPGEVRVVE